METATAPAGLLEGVEIASKYRLGSRLAATGRQADYETIYRGSVARIRIFRCESGAKAAEFASGFGLAFRLPHPNLLAVYDFGQDVFEGEDIAWIVMERGDECLGDILAERKLDDEELRQLLAGIEPPLDFLRARELGHADVCPANVFACGDQIKLSPDRIGATALELRDEQVCRLIFEVHGGEVHGGEPEPVAVAIAPSETVPAPKYRKYAGLAIGGALAAAALCALLVRGAHQTAVTASAPQTVEVVSAPPAPVPAQAQPPRIPRGWAVVAGSFSQVSQAAEAEKHARGAKVYTADDSGTRFVVAYSSGLTESQAKRQLARIRRIAPRGTSSSRFE